MKINQRLIIKNELQLSLFNSQDMTESDYFAVFSFKNKLLYQITNDFPDELKNISLFIKWSSVFSDYDIAFVFPQPGDFKKIATLDFILHNSDNDDWIALSLQIDNYIKNLKYFNAIPLYNNLHIKKQIKFLTLHIDYNDVVPPRLTESYTFYGKSTFDHVMLNIKNIDYSKLVFDKKLDLLNDDRQSFDCVNSEFVKTSKEQKTKNKTTEYFSKTESTSLLFAMLRRLAKKWGDCNLEYFKEDIINAKETNEFLSRKHNDIFDDIIDLLEKNYDFSVQELLSYSHLYTDGLWQKSIVLKSKVNDVIRLFDELASQFVQLTRKELWIIYESINA